ncbi:hypothetical protein H6A64_15255, partial [Lacrimispora saccharolytica]|nr:hypothetical protein [Lacrimispora saccharolytica]
LAQLRKLEEKLKDIIMDSIAKYIDEEKDVAYLIGREKEQTKFVNYLLGETNRTLEQVANIAGVSIEFVKNIQQKLAAEK